MPIRVLAEDVASKIAAGEVVERPASVVKELVENALDAGASMVSVEVQQGGRRLVRVSDNGTGIPVAELPLAFARHATSKISQVEDLESVRTLGFRGEALASVGAVAQVGLLSRPAEQLVGYEIGVYGGRVDAPRAKACPVGTIVAVEQLFFNVPARLKFLRSAHTENARITDVVTRYAIANPEVRFTLTVDGRLSFQSPGTGDDMDVLGRVFGADIAQKLLPIESDESLRGREGGVGVKGYVGSYEIHRASRDYLALFVNRRWIQDRTLAFAVSQAYQGLLPSGRFPVAVILLEMDPRDLDVNVHPTKAEVRFRESGRVFAEVQRLVRRTVVASSPVPSFAIAPDGAAQGDWERRRGLLSIEHAGARATQFALEVQRSGEPGPAPAPGANPLPPLRVLGQLGRLYVIGEGPDGLYLIDQHAAHERVLYDQLAGVPPGEAPSQQMLAPVSVELTARQAAVLEEALPRLIALGFDIEPFGPSACLVRAVPSCVGLADVQRMVHDSLDELGTERPPAIIGDRTIAVVACHAAVREGRVLAFEEMQALVRQLERTAIPRTCPHGRPTVLHLSLGLLEREFRR